MLNFFLGVILYTFFSLLIYGGEDFSRWGFGPMVWAFLSFSGWGSLEKKNPRKITLHAGFVFSHRIGREAALDFRHSILLERAVNSAESCGADTTMTLTFCIKWKTDC